MTILPSMTKQQLALKLFDIGAIKFGEFTLKSGIISPLYIDLRIIVSFPDILHTVAQQMWEKVAPTPCDLLCGVPYTALPIATAISLSHNIPMVMRRKEVKEHGTKKIIEGVFTPGQNVLVIEDLVTSGISVFETITPLENEGLTVTDILVLIDRQQGGKKNISEKGYTLHAVMTITEMLELFVAENKITQETFDSVKKFIEENQTSSPIRGG